MIIKVDHNKCNGCLKCLDTCPINAITKEDVITIDHTRCIKCRTCVVLCPLKAIYIK